MKCIQCGTDNKLKDRTANQGRCIKCQHRFVFEPTNSLDQKITDPMFAKAIADISANNSLFFTPKQFLYFLDHRLRGKKLGGCGWLALYLFFNVWVTIFFGGFSGAFLTPILSNLGLKFGSSFIIANLVMQIYFIYKTYQNTKSKLLSRNGRRQSAKSLQSIGVIILLIAIFICLFILKSFPLFVIYIILGMFSIYLGFKQLNKSQFTQDLLITEDQCQNWLIRWQHVNGSIIKMLPPTQEKSTPITVNPDVTAYSFDRLVVCDSVAVAQMLIANNFHFENNCAILSITGYPENVFDITMQMLRRNPDLTVFALHDCSPNGIKLVNTLRSSQNWFQDSNVTIIDVGLLPQQIMAANRGMFIQTSPVSAEAAKRLAPEIRSSLTNEELQWLEAGYFVELEAFTPQKLIQILQRGIVNSRTLDSDDSSLILVDNSGSSMYVVDSFG